MAEFIGIVEGNRKSASRLGSKKSGIHAVARGWNHGCSVALNGEGDILFSLNGGSNNTASFESIRISSEQFVDIQAGKLRLCLQPIDGGK